MEIVLLTVGKTSIGFVEEGLKEYLGRLKRYVPFRLECIKDVKGAGQLPQERQKELEGNQIQERLQVSDLVVLLDENGRGGAGGIAA